MLARFHPTAKGVSRSPLLKLRTGQRLVINLITYAAYSYQMDYQHIQQRIMNLDPNIRLVTICDMNGNIKFSDHREGVKNLLSPEESKKSLEMGINAWKERSKLAPKIGKGKYVLAEYEKVKRITMPLGEEHLLYITTEPAADHSRIINGARQMAVEARP